MFVSIVLAALAVDGIFSAARPRADPPALDRLDHERGITWNYTTALNIVAFLVFAALFALTMRRGAKDPVCGMTVDRKTPYTSSRDGRTVLLLLGSAARTRFDAYGSTPQTLELGHAPAPRCLRARRAASSRERRSGPGAAPAAASAWSAARALDLQRVAELLRPAARSRARGSATGCARPARSRAAPGRPSRRRGASALGQRRRGLDVEDGLDARLGLLRVLAAGPARAREAQLDLASSGSDDRAA